MFARIYRGAHHAAVTLSRNSIKRKDVMTAACINSTILRRSIATSMLARNNDDGVQTHFPGAPDSRTTHDMAFVNPKEIAPINCFRVMNPDGTIEEQWKDALSHISDEDRVNLHKNMLKLNAMDMIMYDAQRQGLISFYMTQNGEEATHFGSASALKPDDIVFGQYREAGVLMYRGFTDAQFFDQCFSNVDDPAHGRQMPVHYGSKELNFVTISSTLATQMPQASGAAFALKQKKNDAVVVCYFGDGAASEGDAHAAFNFAATLDAPCVFFCRNNGWAISTPTSEQYRGDGIASRGIGYGIPAIRVDGNDLFAVHLAMKEARERALREQTPILVEAMTYRVGHHSTSDDSTAYRPKSEVAYWQTEDNCITRFRNHLDLNNLFPKEEQEAYMKQVRKDLVTAYNAAEKKPKPAAMHLFDQVYDEKPALLLAQEKDMLERVLANKDVYNYGRYAPSE